MRRFRRLDGRGKTIPGVAEAAAVQPGELVVRGIEKARVNRAIIEQRVNPRR